MPSFNLPTAALLWVALVLFSNTNAQSGNNDTLKTNPEQLVVRATNAEDENFVFEKLEKAAYVDLILWRKHLETTLGPYLQDAARKGMKAGTYTVNVRFLVETTGRVSEALALNDPGFGLGKAAATVVKTGPRWLPGQLNGRKVRSYHTQPLTFVISEK